MTGKTSSRPVRSRCNWSSHAYGSGMNFQLASDSNGGTQITVGIKQQSP